MQKVDFPAPTFPGHQTHKVPPTLPSRTEREAFVFCAVDFARCADAEVTLDGIMALLGIPLVLLPENVAHLDLMRAAAEVLRSDRDEVRATLRLLCTPLRGVGSAHSGREALTIFCARPTPAAQIFREEWEHVVSRARSVKAPESRRSASNPDWYNVESVRAVVKMGCGSLFMDAILRRRLRICRFCDLPIYTPLGKIGRPVATCEAHRLDPEKAASVIRKRVGRLANALGRAGATVGIPAVQRRRLRGLAPELYGVGIQSVPQLRAAAQGRQASLLGPIRKAFPAFVNKLLRALGS